MGHLEEMEETATMFETGQLRQLHLGGDISSSYASSLREAITQLREQVKEASDAPRS